MIWWFYRALKDYNSPPARSKPQLLRARSIALQTRQHRTTFTTRHLAAQTAVSKNKDGLLRVLERRNPINANRFRKRHRAFVNEKKKSLREPSAKKAATPATSCWASPKTCMKLKLSFYEFVGRPPRLKGPKNPPIASLIRPAPHRPNAERPEICPNYKTLIEKVYQLFKSLLQVRRWLQTQDRRRRDSSFARSISSAPLRRHVASSPGCASTPPYNRRRHARARQKGRPAKKGPPPAKARDCSKTEDAAGPNSPCPMVWRRRALYFWKSSPERRSGIAPDPEPRLFAGPRARSTACAIRKRSCAPIHDLRQRRFLCWFVRSVVDGYRPGMATLKDLLQTLCGSGGAAGGSRRQAAPGRRGRAISFSAASVSGSTRTSKTPFGASFTRRQGRRPFCHPP